MSLIIENSPQQFTPVYNDLFWVFSSTDSTNDGYRYIVWLYVNGTVVKKDKIVPMPATSDGKANASTTLSTRVSYHELFPIDTTSGAVDGENLSYITAKIAVGEEYFGSTWEFTGYGYAGTSTGWSNQTDPSINPGGWARTFLRQSTSTSPYSAGDIIEVTLDDPNTNSFIGGIHKILDTYTFGGQYYVVLELPWQTLQTPSTFAGDTTYADGRKTVIEPDGEGGVESDEIIAFNGAETFENFKNWDFNDWLMNDSSSKFLTSLPRDEPLLVTDNSAVFLQWYNDVNEVSGYNIAMRFITYVGDTPDSPDDRLASTVVDGVVMMDCSPDILNGLSGKSKYTVNLYNSSGGGSTISETLTFIKDDRCYEWDRVEMAFMDRMGSILPFQFTLRHDKRMTSTKENYKKDLTTDEMYDYDYLDTGLTPLEIDENIIYTLRTDALTFAHANYLRELVTSPFTAITLDGTEWFRCNVRTSNLDIKRQIAGRHNYYTIEVEMSNKDKVNW